jgi:signal transduction histidine kinase
MAGDGQRDASETAWEFTVQPAYYQTTWFYALCIWIAVAATWWAWRLRVAFIRQQFSLALAERARLSRELHDTLLQSLVGVTLQLRAVGDAVGADWFWTRDQLTRIRRHVEAYIGEAEQSIRDLRSPSLVKKDLVSALNEFGAETVAPVRHPFRTGRNLASATVFHEGGGATPQNRTGSDHERCPARQGRSDLVGCEERRTSSDAASVGQWLWL